MQRCWGGNECFIRFYITSAYMCSRPAHILKQSQWQNDVFSDIVVCYCQRKVCDTSSCLTPTTPPPTPFLCESCTLRHSPITSHLLDVHHFPVPEGTFIFHKTTDLQEWLFVNSELASVSHLRYTMEVLCDSNLHLWHSPHLRLKWRPLCDKCHTLEPWEVQSLT